MAIIPDRFGLFFQAELDEGKDVHAPQETDREVSRPRWLEVYMEEDVKRLTILSAMYRYCYSVKEYWRLKAIDAEYTIRRNGWMP